jgi:hypothetical protein
MPSCYPGSPPATDPSSNLAKSLLPLPEYNFVSVPSEGPLISD